MRMPHMPNAQKCESAGSAVEMEMANATKSVSDVTVIETAALPSAWLTRSAAARTRSSSLAPGRHATAVCSKQPRSYVVSEREFRRILASLVFDKRAMVCRLRMVAWQLSETTRSGKLVRKQSIRKCRPFECGP